MEIQIGQVNIKIRLNVVDRSMKINIVAPMVGEMAYLKIFIDGRDEENPLTYDFKPYKKGDKDAEKSAVS